MKRLLARTQAVIAWAMTTRPARAWTRYSKARGPLLAQGLSYQAIFALFAALWVTFAVAGFVVRGDPGLQQALVETLNRTIPGLFETPDSEGAISLDALLSASILGWTGAIAALGLVATALGWLASAREAIQAIFGLRPSGGNPVLLKLLDLGIAIGLGAAVIASMGLTVASTTALSWLLEAVGVGERSVAGTIAARVAGIAASFVIDAVVLALFYRVLSGVRVPIRVLAQGVAVGAAALGVLKILGTALLGGASSNPLLASFAVILGLLIWFNLLCQVLLVAAAWIAESAADAGVDLAAERDERTRPAKPRRPRVRLGRRTRQPLP